MPFSAIIIIIIIVVVVVIIVIIISFELDQETTHYLSAECKTPTANEPSHVAEDVLYTVTHLYSTTRRAPLPQADEVLLCTPKTTCEQVQSWSLKHKLQLL